MRKPALSLLPLALFLLFSEGARPQERSTEIVFSFRVNSAVVDTLYGDNAARIRELGAFLRDIGRDTTVSVTGVTYRGGASPEASYEWNNMLSRGRIAALEGIVRRELKIPDSLITRDDSYIPWQYLAQRVERSEIPGRQRILEIIAEDEVLVPYHLRGEKVDWRVVKLQALNGGEVWKRLDSLFFPAMRNACVVFVTCRKAAPPAAVPAPPAVEAGAVCETAAAIAEKQRWRPRLHVKTNAIGWGMGMANIAVEIDMARHWSFALPVHWSAWNYFKSTLKFRTLALQPELRYWLRPENDGWFAAGHLGIAWYNFAADGKWRIQDHKGHSPATGGGLAAGYRLPLGRGKRWRMEFSLGAGIYSLHYDKFHNYSNGHRADTRKKTWFGVDQAAVALAYTLNLGGKGGGR